MVITHSPKGEYPRHKRHEQIGEAMITLWRTGRVNLNILWASAYEDDEGAYYPKVIPKAEFTTFFLGVDAHAAHFESAQEKEWYYRWLRPQQAFRAHSFPTP
tara:strand:+ start:255 stop:560 length:306 start_codon:yes stop_codon:yes gene_type:complete